MNHFLDFATIDKHYIHISKRLHFLWGEPEFVPYIDILLMDTRSHQREGFPIEVSAALFSLRKHHIEKFPQYDS